MGLIDGLHNVPERFKRCCSSLAPPPTNNNNNIALVWGLEQAKYFTQGCDNLVVITDHKPLVKIFGDRTLDEITNTRLFRFKQRTLMWRFEVAYLPGVTNQAADATSRHPVPCDYLATIASADSASPDHEETALLAAVEQDISRNFCLQWSELAHKTDSDAASKELLPAIQSGFPSDYYGSAPVRPYLPFRDGYFVHNGVVLYYDRIVIPLSLRRKVLSILHSAHQGVSAMERRARATVFWPGMTKDIQAVRQECGAFCN